MGENIEQAIIRTRRQPARFLTACLTLALCGGCALAPVSSPPQPPQQLLSSFEPSPYFGEQTRQERLPSGVRIVYNAPAPAAFDRGKPNRIVIYALPNGNNIEQTLGARLTPGLDFHFDIQHIAAQTRALRQVVKDENIVVALVEADGKSWPAWRAKHADNAALIAAIVARIAAAIPGEKHNRITLAAHSGGGSFIVGLLNGGAIPAAVDRIAFLDANYSYDSAQGHGDLLLRWLRADARHQLMVLAYDDRRIEIDGKPVVGPDGGTWRASQRMSAYFASQTALTTAQDGDFDVVTALPRAGAGAGTDTAQIAFYLHRNPENKILHTRLIGEMNGYLMAATFGTAQQASWGAFGGPRAYEPWVQALPSVAAPAPFDRIAARAPDAPGGGQFIASLAGLSNAEREAAVLSAILAGNVPDFLRKPVAIEAEAVDAAGVRHAVRYHVMPDYLAIGSDTDFVRMPMTPMTAQALADAFGCLLPTAGMADAIWRQARIRQEPQPLTEAREAAATFLRHHALIEAQRAKDGQGGLIAGIKKDIVTTPRLLGKTDRVAIYGWHHLDGAAIQPLSLVHKNSYVDYSHGVRLVRAMAEVDGKPVPLLTILGDPVLSKAVSNEGPFVPARY